MAVQNSVSTGGLSKIMQMTTTPPVNYRLESGEEQIIENKLRVTNFGVNEKENKHPYYHSNEKSCSQGTASFVSLGFGELALDALDALGILGASSGSGQTLTSWFSWQFVTILNNS